MTIINQSQIIQYWGYPVEVYDVTTSDGYILTVQRIPRGRHDSETGNKRRAVFLQHGLLGSSSQWITNLPHQSLGFVLADRGFDVWLGNSRGNVYALKHEHLSTDSDKFWDFRYVTVAIPLFHSGVINGSGVINCEMKYSLAYSLNLCVGRMHVYN